MRGRVISVSLLLLSLASPLFPACSFVPRYSGQFRTTALDVSTAGDGYLWLATGYGLQLFDVSAPREPKPLDSLALPGITRVVHAAANGIAYAGTGSRIAVVRRDGQSLRLVGTVEGGGTVQDIVLASNLFAATTAGIAHFDLIDPENPVRTSAILPTSSPSVSSLAVGGTTLYATDTDSTVEQFNISIPSIPQNIGKIEALTRSFAVHYSGGLLYVSDQFGQSTDVYAGTTRLARLARGGTSFAAGPGSIRFLAGPDRILRASDLSAPDRPVDLLQIALPPTDGTDNVIHAMVHTASTLYVAAGDIGLVVVDAGALGPPYPLAAYSTAATTSVAAAAGKTWFTASDGTIQQHRINATGLGLVSERSWPGGGGARVHDVSGDLLLSSSGAAATLWSLSPQVPVSTMAVTFSSGVRSAAIRGSGIVALLDDGSVWTASPSLQQIAVPKMTALARAGSAFALAEAREKTTVVHYFAAGDFGAPARQITVEGLPIGGLALNATRAALFTFHGLTIIDLATSATDVVEGSASAIPRQIVFSGGALLVLADRELLVYDDAATLVQRHSLPADATAMAAAAPHAAFSTTTGTMVAAYDSSLATADISSASVFYRDAAAPTGRLALSGGGRIDLFSVVSGEAPHFSQGLDAHGVIDIAATPDAVYTLTNSATLTAWSRAGVQIARRTFSEGSDSQPIGLAGVGDAVWVSFSKGCLSGGCRKESLVIDPASLATTAVINGGVVEAVSAGTRAWALFALPDEIRAFNITDSLHPATTASVAAPASARSIAHGGGRAIVLGDRIYLFNDSSLAAAGTALSTSPPTPAHRVRVDGDCALVTGRSFDPELYDARDWTPLPLPGSLPSTVRTVVQQDGRFTILTDHSIEIWTDSVPQAPAKRKGVR